MNAVHGRDEINPFASSSCGTYAELAVEDSGSGRCSSAKIRNGRAALRVAISDAANRVTSQEAPALTDWYRRIER
jgi:hypothetical protein